MGVRRDALLYVAEVAHRLRVCQATVYKLCARGELAHLRILNVVRIAPEALDTFARAWASPRTAKSKPRAPDERPSQLPRRERPPSR